VKRSPYLLKGLIDYIRVLEVIVGEEVELIEEVSDVDTT
jgi:hypothetical protein